MGCLWCWGCSIGAQGAVTAAQPIHVAAGPRVWWPRGAEATLERVVINTSPRQKPEKEIVLSGGNADLETTGVDKLLFQKSRMDSIVVAQQSSFSP